MSSFRPEGCSPLAQSSLKFCSELGPSLGLSGWRGQCTVKVHSPGQADTAGHHGDHRGGDGKTTEEAGGGRHWASWASRPPRMCGVECLQACVSRPGCLRNFRGSAFPDALLCPAGRAALGEAGSVLSRPPSITWQQWEMTGIVSTARVRHESKGDGKRPGGVGGNI